MIKEYSIIMHHYGTPTRHSQELMAHDFDLALLGMTV